MAIDCCKGRSDDESVLNRPKPRKAPLVLQWSSYLIPLHYYSCLGVEDILH